MCSFAIEPLPREQWAGFALPLEYTSDAYYDLVSRKTADGFVFELTLKPFDTPITHTQAEWDYPDKLHQPWWEKSQAWGIVRGGELLAAIETCPEEWSNRLQVTELWVSEPLRGQGVGHALMVIAKEQTVREKRRALILETQTCNIRAIGFYLHEGFQPIGLDTCCYTNRDIERREVRLNMGWFPEKTEGA